MTQSYTLCHTSTIHSTTKLAHADTLSCWIRNKNWCGNKYLNVFCIRVICLRVGNMEGAFHTHMVFSTLRIYGYEPCHITRLSLFSQMQANAVSNTADALCHYCWDSNARQLPHFETRGFWKNNILCSRKYGGKQVCRKTASEYWIKYHAHKNVCIPLNPSYI